MISIQRSTRRWISLVFILVIAIGSFLFVGTDAAVAEETWGYAIAHDLMSPYCPGRTLATCPSPQAAELVQWIVMQEAAGVTQEQVIEMLIERFGEDILGAPKAEGMTLWAYIMPVLVFVVGGAAAFFVLRRIVGGNQSRNLEVSMAGAGTVSSSPPASSVPLTPPTPQAHQAPQIRQTPQSSEALEASSRLDDDELAQLVDGDLDRRA